MRIITLTCAGLLSLGATSVQAAPSPIAKAHPAGITTSPAIELVAQGCGYGQRRTYWQDQWGRCIAVGMAITGQPPHRTGRAAFPHPAPTLDV